MNLTIRKKDIQFGAFIFSLCCSYMDNRTKVLGFFVFCVVTFLCSGIKRSIDKFSGSLVFFTIWLCASYMWANKLYMDSTIPMYTIICAFEILYLSLWVFQIVKTEEDCDKLINSIIISHFFLLIYLVANTPLSHWGSQSLGKAIGMQRNGLGMQMALGAVFSVYFVRKNGIKDIKHIIATVLFVLVVLFTGSRKALLVVGGGIAIFWIVCDGNKKLWSNIFKIIVLLLIVWWLVMRVPVFYDTIGYRVEILVKNIFADSTVTDKSIVERDFYKQQALKLFYQSPIIGCGLDGFRTYMKQIAYSHVAYSHCNFTELLANYGLIGFVAYYLPRVGIFLKYVRAKVYKDSKIGALFFGVLPLLFVLEYGLVSYFEVYFQTIYIIAFAVLNMLCKRSDEKNEYTEVC